MKTTSNVVALFNSRIANSTTISEMKPEKKSALEWNTPVHVERLFTSGGIDSGIFGVIATPADGRVARVVGQYSKGETLLSNSDVISRTKDALDNLGLTYRETFRVCRDGSGLEATFTILNYDLGTVNHSKALPQIVIRNSYDGKWKFSGEFRVLMLVCLNGMEGLTTASALLAKHSSKLSLGIIAGGIENLIKEGKEGIAFLPKLQAIKFDSDLMAMNFFSNVQRFSKGVISKRNASQMFSAYLEPDENEAKLTPSVWRGYMAGTRAMRDLAEVRPTAAQAANASLGKLMGYAATKGGASFLETPPASASLVEFDLIEA